MTDNSLTQGFQLNHVGSDITDKQTNHIKTGEILVMEGEGGDGD